MTMHEVVVSTPRYVLLDGNRRLGPEVISSDLGHECSVIYGFSGKDAYDRFLANSDLALRPYPLVEGYLRNQVGDAGGDLQLIVADADGPRERRLQALTMAAVLQAQETRLAQLPAAHQFVLDQQANAYRLEAAICD